MIGGINCKILSLGTSFTLSIAMDYKRMKLDQFLKWHNVVSSGGEAKILINSGQIKVNGEIEKKRGRKLVKGDKVMFLKSELIFE